MSTHIVEDIYRICEELAVLKKGRLFYAGAASALLSRVENKVKAVHLEGEEQLPELQKRAVVLSAAWGVLFAAVLISLWDDFPSDGNLARLEFLSRPSYFVFRIISLDGLIMVFGLMFLLSNRFPVDKKTGVKPLMMVSPVRKAQYVTGKLAEMLNVSHVNSAESSSFYLITSGALTRLLWVHPEYSRIDYGSVWKNLVFMLAGGFGSGILLIMKRKFWRPE